MGKPHDAPAVAIVDLIASVQTSQLDSRPELRVSSALPAEGWSNLIDDRFKPVTVDESHPIGLPPERVAGCLLCRIRGGELSFVQMIHPRDLGQASLHRDPDGMARVEHQLLTHHLEKGVIVRSRLRGVFLKRDGDSAAAAKYYGEFSSGKLPLTA